MRRYFRGVLGLTFGAVAWIGYSGSLDAQVIPYNGNSLGSLVSAGCASGDCSISGGTRKGSNLFHRFDKFDTHPLNRISFENGRAKHLIIGVVSEAARINKPITLTGAKGSIYVLSPKGIRIEAGASFDNVNTVLLTTSGKINLGGSVFDYSATDIGTINSAANMTEFTVKPETTLELIALNLHEGLVATAEEGGYFETEDAIGGIHIGGGVNLVVDKSLVIVANKAPIKIDGLSSSVSLTARGSSIGESHDKGNGIGIVGQDVSVIGSDLAPVLLKAGQIDIHEPKPLPAVAPGLLASEFINPQALVDDDLADYAGTLSNIQLTNVDFVALEDASTKFTLKIAAYGLGCFPQDCGLPEERFFVIGDGSTVRKQRIGRPAIFFEDTTNPQNPENYGDYTNAGEADEAGRGVYAGMNLENIRIISGYNRSLMNREIIDKAKNSPDSISIQLDIGRLGGARARNISLIINDFQYLAELRLGNNDMQPALPSNGEAKFLFLNNQAYAKGDTAMYWYPSSDGFGTNSIRVTPLPALPSKQQIASFDSIFLNVDQNVFEDYEATFSVDSSRNASHTNQKTNANTLVNIQLEDDPAEDDASK